MWNRRYPYRDVGRAAARLFGIAGAVGGVAAAALVAGAPPLLLNAAFWAFLGVAAGYVVFSSEGPRERPASVVQASVADGLVAGVIAAASGALLDVLVAGGAGSTTGSQVSFLSALGALGAGAGAGAVAGSLLGLVLYRILGADALERKPPKRKRGGGARRARK